jgi:hypothetical protein
MDPIIRSRRHPTRREILKSSPLAILPLALPSGNFSFFDQQPMTANGGKDPYPIPWLDKNGSHNQPAGPNLEPSHIYHFKGRVARSSTFTCMGTDNQGNRMAFVPFVLDPARARPLSATLLKKVTWLTPNQTETEALLNRHELGPSEGLDAATAMLQKRPKNVILKLDARGCALAPADKTPEFIPAFSIATVDTTAAGDAFNGGFAVRLMRGDSTRDSAIFVSAVAAISVSRHGAQPSMPTESEVLAFLNERKSDPHARRIKRRLTNPVFGDRCGVVEHLDRGTTSFPKDIWLKMRCGASKF